MKNCGDNLRPWLSSSGVASGRQSGRAVKWQSTTSKSRGRPPAGSPFAWGEAPGGPSCEPRVLTRAFVPWQPLGSSFALRSHQAAGESADRRFSTACFCSAPWPLSFCCELAHVSRRKVAQTIGLTVLWDPGLLSPNCAGSSLIPSDSCFL